MIKRNTNVKSQKASRRLLVFAAVALIVGSLACWGAYRGFFALREVWLEQFRIKDKNAEAFAVVVTYSPKPEDADEEKNWIEIVKYHLFHLTNGVNLATFPYAERRAEALEKYPEIKDIQIERRLPLRVNIRVEGRTPAVRIAPLKGNPRLVADYEGVVFSKNSNRELPTIREADETRCKRGQRLDGNARAALQLVRVLADAASGKSDDVPELASIQVREIDTSETDFLHVTLGDSSTVDIAWDHMGDESEVAYQSLNRQLRHLAQVIAANLTPPATRWIATEYEKDGRIYADDPNRAGKR